MHWKTLKKILANEEPPGYRMTSERPKPKIGPWLDRISEILESDKGRPKKQRHTGKRIYERICEEGYEGSYTTVKRAPTPPTSCRFRKFAHTASCSRVNVNGITRP